jgi:ferredoxin
VNVNVDLGLCNGYGHCVIEAPDYFELDEESGKAVVRKKELTEDDRAAVETAILLCPVQAISLSR